MVPRPVPPEDPATTPVLVLSLSPRQREEVEAVLGRAGRPCRAVDTGAELLERLAEEPPELVVLDLAVRDLNGYGLLRRVRLMSDVPVIAISRTDAEFEAVRALRAGADDVLAPPVSPAALLARVEALLRRARRSLTQPVLRQGEVEIDLTAVEVRVAGEPVALAPVQFRLLATLVRHAGEVLAPARLAAAVWGDGAGEETARLKVTVSALRRRLRLAGHELPIETVRGFGYRYAAARPPAGAAPGTPAVDALPIGCLTIDAGGTVRASNPAADRLLGAAPGTLIGCRVEDVIPGLMPVPAPQQEPVEVEDPTEGRRELTGRRRDGREVPIEVTLSRQSAGQEVLTHAFLLDASARRASEARLEHMSLHDELTGLANRVHFVERARSVLEAGRRDEAPCAIFLIDLDRFTLVNETLGPAAGDNLLREAAWRLRSCVRPTDTVARFGGDEFALLCEGLRTAGQTAALVDRIERAFTRPFLSERQRHVMTASIGGALSGPAASDAETLIRRAHTALYRAKDRGRTHFEMFDPAMHTRAMRAFELQRRLRGTLDDGRAELSVVYQPIVSLASRRPVAFEALLRWRTAGEQVAPAEFIPIAEATELIVPLGGWVVEQALGQLARWRRLSGAENLSMSVNLSPRQLADDRLVTRIAGALHRNGIPPSALVLEITETAVTREADEVPRTLSELRRLGVRMMLDDFGTGYSSLAHVVRFPIDGLKIDRAFIERMELDPGARAIVDSVVGLASGLGAIVIAEGIETDAQLHRAHTAGCGFGQGYRFGPPVAPEAASAWLRRYASSSTSSAIESTIREAR